MSAALRWGSRIGHRLWGGQWSIPRNVVCGLAITHFCVDGGKPCYRIGGRWCGTWCGVYWARRISVLLKRTKASETQRTQTKLYLEILLSPKRYSDENTRRTFGLRKPHRKREEGSQHKVFQKSVIPSKQDQFHPSQSTKFHLSKPLSRAQRHGKVVGTTNPLTILIYRPSVLQVVGLVVRCTEGDDVLPYPGISHKPRL